MSHGVIRSAIVRVPPGDELEPVAESVAARVLGVERPSTHPDFELYRPDGNIFRVGLVSELVFRSVLSPAAGDKRVVAVLEPERMNEAGANLLLKVLEEPPPSLHIFFVTSRPYDLAATVRSRCVLLDAPAADRESVFAAEGVPPAQARRLSFLVSSSRRAGRVARDLAQRELLEAWVQLPGQVGSLPADCLALPEPIARLVSSSPSGDEDERRRQRRERTDDLLAGLEIVASLYREVLARAVGASVPDPTVEEDSAAPVATRLVALLGVPGALEGLRHVVGARDAILANGSVRLVLEALALRLGALGGAHVGAYGGVLSGPRGHKGAPG
jgi:DNA polymerase III delta subunit-like protein